MLEALAKDLSGGVDQLSAPRGHSDGAHSAMHSTQPIGIEGRRAYGARDSLSREPTVTPRLLSIQQAADFLGVSYWTMRDLLDNGTVKRVRLPVGRREVRRVLVDAKDLDRLVDAWKSD